MSFSEFKPTIVFLVKFVAYYIVGNVLYGLFVTAYEPKVDPVTHHVTHQVSIVLQTCGYDVNIEDHEGKATTNLTYLGKAKLSVYEGCNGLNTIVVFLAFVLAFGPINRSLVWFIPLGILLIHITNLARISLLFLVAEYLPYALYFTHKFLFTAVIYLVIFCLWIWWVRRSIQTSSFKSNR